MREVLYNYPTKFITLAKVLPLPFKLVPIFPNQQLPDRLNSKP